MDEKLHSVPTVNDPSNGWISKKQFMMLIVVKP